MELYKVRELMIKKRYLIHAHIIEQKGFDLNVNLSDERLNEVLEDVNKTIENMVEALEDWRYDTELQFDEDSEEFNNWVGDTLEVQEDLTDNYITLEDIKKWSVE